MPLHKSVGVRVTLKSFKQDVPSSMDFTLEGAQGGEMGRGNEIQESRTGLCCLQRASCKKCIPAAMIYFVSFKAKTGFLGTIMLSESALF